MEQDAIDSLSRNLSGICSHRLKDWQKCTLCNVIMFENPHDALGDLPWDDLIIASPRMKQLDPAEIPDMIRRMKGENALLELDSRTKFRKHTEFIDAHFSQTSQLHASGPKESVVVNFRPNIQGDRDSVFPKVPYTTAQEFQSIAPSREGSDCEAPPETVKDPRIRIFLPPYGGKDIYMGIHRSVRARDLIIDILSKAKDLSEAINWRLRWAEDEEEGLPDYELPAIDGEQIVMDLNTTELCLSDN